MGNGPRSCHDGPVTSPARAAMVSPSTSRRMSRPSDGRLVAGVAAGVAAHLGVDVWVVRAAFILLSFASGAGIVAYGCLWVLVPQSGEFDAPSTPVTGFEAAPEDWQHARVDGPADSTAERPWRWG